MLLSGSRHVPSPSSLVCFPFTSLLFPILTRHRERQEINGSSPPAPGRVLYTLPTALYQAGVQLMYLDVNVSGKYYGHPWDLNEDTRDSLRALAKTLKVLDYRGPPDCPEAHCNKLSQYLGPLLSGEKLERLGINFRSESSETKEIGPFLAFLPPRSSLRYVSLMDCSINLHELQTLLHQRRPKVLEPQSLSLTLHGVQLLSGTWAQALDLLRGHVSWESALVRPTGAECDNMLAEEYADIFCAPARGMSEATQYITWDDAEMSNPLIPESESEDVDDSSEEAAEELGT